MLRFKEGELVSVKNDMIRLPWKVKHFDSYQNLSGGTDVMYHLEFAGSESRMDNFRIEPEPNLEAYSSIKKQPEIRVKISRNGSLLIISDQIVVYDDSRAYQRVQHYGISFITPEEIHPGGCFADDDRPIRTQNERKVFDAAIPDDLVERMRRSKAEYETIMEGISIRVTSIDPLGLKNITS